MGYVHRIPSLRGRQENERLVTYKNASYYISTPEVVNANLKSKRKSVYLQIITNEIQDAFTNTNNVTKSHIPA
ncbi:hypothetical protein HanRHA438_Chr09g0403831 [Helianthus annuus]|nr:hypothetical protein HanRHA438_Chr09g0403831 [Helianthus annuus]